MIRQVPIRPGLHAAMMKRYSGASRFENTPGDSCVGFPNHGMPQKWGTKTTADSEKIEKNTGQVTFLEIQLWSGKTRFLIEILKIESSRIQILQM